MQLMNPSTSHLLLISIDKDTNQNNVRIDKIFDFIDYF